MIKAVLFDLDDTLLGNRIDSFIPQYFSLLGKYAERYMDRNQFLQEMLYCTRVMMLDTNTAVTNRDVFWNTFQERNSLDPQELEPFFDNFYKEQFPQLAPVTQKREISAELVQTCLDHDLQVVVATNPVFPAVAIEERLRWAGIPTHKFAYALVTTYENMTSTKPHRSYYEQILAQIDCVPEQAIMVGDDWDNDMKPAAKMGMKAYWIQPNGKAPPDASLIVGQGTIDSFYHYLTKELLVA